MSMAIDAQNLMLNYGDGHIIGPLNLQIAAGSCVALIGPNGAGKTSLVHMLLNLRPPSQGTVHIHGVNSMQAASRAKVGYLPEVTDFAVKASALDLLHLHAALLGDTTSSCKAWLAEFGLSDPYQSIETFSKGMRQRLGLAIAFWGEPHLLILDEPNSGLDPVGIVDLRNRMVDAKEKGITILISTHRLAEIMPIADQIIIMHKGKIAGMAAASDFADYQAMELFFLERVK